MTDAMILTASLDIKSQSRFDAERERYFPQAINFLAAHVTLFHALPFDEREAVTASLDQICRAETMSGFSTAGLRFLGRGVAYELRMPPIVSLRAKLAAAWSSWLTPQDRQTFRPHVTVQNKVPPAQARALLGELRAAYTDWNGTVTGLALWKYENGPWSPIADWQFAAAPGVTATP